MEQTLGFSLSELVDRNTRPRRHNCGDVLVGDLVIHHPISRGLAVFCRGNRGFNTRNDLVIEFGCVFVTALAHRAVEINTSVVKLGFELTDVLK